MKSDELAAVQRRAAAHGDDTVMATSPVGGNAIVDVAFHRVRLDAIEHHCGNACGAAEFDRLRNHRHGGQPAVGNQEWPGDAGGVTGGGRAR